jgi:ribosomal protein S18 acetylase RimI-like enzyme
MIKIAIANTKDIDKILETRYETIKAVCNLEESYNFSESFKENTRKYYENADHTTVLALKGETVVGCATLCYIDLLPTFDHPGGKSGHIMNVHTNVNFRKQGIAYKMMKMLIDDAKKNGATELSLDATVEGRPLYEKCGFVASTEGMVLNLNCVVE